MIQQITAVLLALVLSLGAINTVAYAQNATNATATDIQIQLVPNLQRGHNQHVTLYAVDEDGNEVANESISAEITNEAGRNVGLGQFTTQTGEDQSYKVGPNTRPQNITIDAQLSYDGNVSTSEQYSVFAKPKAPEPEPTPVENVTDPAVNVTEPVDGNVTEPVTNVTEPVEGNVTEPVNGNVTEPTEGNVTEPVANATTGFDVLENSTAILEQEIEDADNGGNETDRADVKAAVGETLSALGGVASEVATATNEQLQVIQGTAEAVADAIDQVVSSEDE